MDIFSKPERHKTHRIWKKSGGLPAPGKSCLSFFPIGLLKPLSVQSVQGQTAQKKWLKEKFTSLKRTPPSPGWKISENPKRGEKMGFFIVEL